MTDLDLAQFDWSRSLAVLRAPSLGPLLHCPGCSAQLGHGAPVLVSGRCGHRVCGDCVKQTKVCPREGCGLATQPRDYTEDRSMAAVASSLANIRGLLEKAQSARAQPAAAATARTPRVNKENAAGIKTTETPVASSNKVAGKRKAKGVKSKDVTGENVLGELKNVAEKNTNGKLKKINMKEKAPMDFTSDSTEKGKSKDRKEDSNKAKSDNKRLSLPEKKPQGQKRVRSATVAVDISKGAGTSKKPTNIEKKNAKGETLVHVACSKGQVDKVRALLAEGANPNTRDHAGWTPLHDAVDGGRAEIVELLLRAGANPSVPSGDQRVTALHEAVSRGHAELVRLLVAHGADRDAKDSSGNTPRSIAAGHKEDGIRKALEDTKVVVDLNESVKVNPVSKETLLCLSKKLSKSASMKKITDIVTKLNVKRPVADFTSSVTHYVIDEEEKLLPDSYPYLASMITGAVIVSQSWLVESGKQGKLLDAESFSRDFSAEDEVGVGRAREVITLQQPRLLAGLHVYLLGNFAAGAGAMAREEVAALVRLAEGKLVTREPDPEWIPEAEMSIPHHAEAGAAMAKTSHVLVYQDKEADRILMKYNMKHIKTLPLSWLVKCLRQYTLLDPEAPNPN